MRPPAAPLRPGPAIRHLLAFGLSLGLLADAGADDHQRDGDDHGDSRSSATHVSLPSQTSGEIDSYACVYCSGLEEDYFRFKVSRRGEVLVYTTGGLDTMGTLYDSAGRRLAFSFTSARGSYIDGDAVRQIGREFLIRRELAAGTYYVAVSADEVGTYTLSIGNATSIEDPSGGGSGSSAGGSIGNGSYRRALGDFDGNGRDDVLLRNEDGRWYYYPMDGRRHQAGRGIANLTRNLEWSVAGIGDFNGDGRDDVLLRHKNGRWYYYPMHGRLHLTAIRGPANLTRDLEWSVAGIGDFDGDGRDDVLLRHADGRWYYYPMDGRRHMAGRGIANLTRNLEWSVAGIGDLNGDRRDDVLLRKPTTGAWYYYPMNGRQIWAGRGPASLPYDLEWSVAGIGDFNGDFKDEVLLRHEDGRWYHYPMHGRGHLLGWEGPANLTRNLEWSVAGIGDLNGDGRDDVLLRKQASGVWHYYPMNGRLHLPERDGRANLTSNLAWRGLFSVGGTGRRFRDCDECPLMAVVPAGTFMMGAPESYLEYEHPVHLVTIAAPFAVGVYEVTFAEWDACVADGGCAADDADPWSLRDHGWGRGRRPVMNVTWEEAKSYVEWLSGKTGESYRLLSESEWEYAARAGTQTTYSWGDEMGENQANCRDDPSYSSASWWGAGCGDQWSERAPVGSFPANAWGLHDMHGNVEEWVEDCWNGSYAGAPRDGRAWLSGDCGFRVYRGGSWYASPIRSRASSRGYWSADSGLWDVGFRVARTRAP